MTGGLTIAFLLIMLVAVLAGQDDVATWLLLLLGVPCAVGLISGAAELMRRRSPAVLFGSACPRSPSCCSRWSSAWWNSRPLPLLTAIFAKVGTVTGWVAAAYR